MWMMHFADQEPDAVSEENAQALAENAEAEESTVGDEVTETTLAMLPWVTSIILHVGLVVVAFFVVWSTITSVDEEEVIIPVVTLSPTPGAPISIEKAERVKKKTQAKRAISRAKTPSISRSMKSKVSMKTNLVGAKGALGSKASPFAASVGAAAEFKTTFMGNNGGNARRIVFLVDASGSLIDTLPAVIVELKRSISELSSKQSFTVIFFSGDKLYEPAPIGLKKATSQTKARVSNWADTIIPRGKTDPVKAIKQALRYKPQLVFLLSDNITGKGLHQIDQRRLIKEINDANRARTKICTIQFLYPDPLTRLGLPGTLERISEETVGTYKFVESSDLNLPEVQ